MSLCPHGYTAFWDCPYCECPGCGRTQDACVCHIEPKPEYHGAAGPVVVIDLEREDQHDPARGIVFGTAIALLFFWLPAAILFFGGAA